MIFFQWLTISSTALLVSSEHVLGLQQNRITP